MHELHAEAPAKGEYEPAMHCRHCDQPLLAEYWPLGQVRHLADPTGAYVPAAQGKHGPALEGTLPAGHADPQPAAPGVVEADPGVPDAHCRHDELPALAAYEAAGQAVQELLPAAFAIVPGLQGVQRVLPPVEKVPAGHCTQAPLPVDE